MKEQSFISKIENRVSRRNFEMNPNTEDSNMYATEDDFKGLDILNYDQLVEFKNWAVRRPAPKPPRSQDLTLPDEVSHDLLLPDEVSQQMLNDGVLLETFAPFTENVFQNLEVPMLEHWSKFPNTENVNTDYAFDIHIDPCENQNWLFDQKIGKVYIKRNIIMKVTFLYKPQEPTKLFLRAMILYSNPNNMHLQVNRCANHRLSNDNTEIPPAHILRCCQPNTRYVGEENAQLFGQRLSIVVPLEKSVANEDGIVKESLMFEFMCQNSCTTGISRKATAVVFTLENERGEMVGKSVLPFKVCSCPKRDMQREGGTQTPRKRESAGTSYGKPPTKMMRLPENKKESPSTSHSSELPIPDTSHTVTLTMPSKQSIQHVLRCALNEVSALLRKEGQSEELISCAEKIEGLIVAHS